MSLRRFMVLVRGLGPQSATVTYMSDRHSFGPREVTDEQAAENALARMFHRKPAQVH
jgi:hypothetical protein